VGTTDVVWSYADEDGNIVTCTQMVTVTDVDAPEVFGCSEDITVACDEVVTYEAPIAIDICEDIAIAGFTYLGGFEGKRYYLSDNNFNAPNAIIDAEAQNGFVAEIISQEHNDWLRAKFDELGEGKVIIGYSDTAVEGTFEWHNGNATTYTNWSSNEPNDFGSNGEDYTEMREDGQWNDTGNNASKKYLLEMTATPMTQTAGLPSGSVFPIGTTTNTFEATDAAGNIVSCSFDVIVEPCTDFALDLKVFLQGAALNPNVGEETLMRDDLRVAGFIPTRSPYADMLNCESSVFNTTGADAIVDWVWIELRDKDDNTSIQYSRSALLQRDGDIVDVDGVSTLNFSTSDDTYYIVLKHRNHLGIMSIGALTFNATNSVNFSTSNSAVTFGINAQTTSGMPSGVAAMWCGNANNDTVVQYSGTSPDTPNILSEVLNDAGNFLNFPTYSLTGYNMNDVNMDGVIQYSGTNPDTPFILQNVLASPANFLGFSTFSIMEQLPENLLN
ncbi:MAG: HYR domain-containing protein, partial [Bacteroidota bacterium]